MDIDNNDAPEGVSEDTTAADLVADTEDQTSGDDAAAAAEGDDGAEQQPPPKRTSAQERIDELTRDKHAERRAREAAERRIAELEARAPEPKADQPKADAEPDPADFQYGETDAGYIRALARFEARQEFAEQAQARERETQARTIDQTWNERQQTFAKDKPDYFTVIDGEWTCSRPMADAIRTSEDGAAVAYHLASNPDEARRIAALQPLAQIREIGRIEARLATPASAVQQPKTISDAPAPHPQTRGSGGKFKVDPATADFASFDKAY